MPELPEIETLKLGLVDSIKNKSISKIVVRETRLRWPVDQKKLETVAINEVITDISRRAKYLLIHLSHDKILIIHLGMSGGLLLISEELPFDKHDHIIFYFNDDTELRYRDPRRFGMVELILTNELADYERFVRLGFEPLDKATTATILFEKAQKLTKPIKNLLMDAHFIVGIGNIYANEALFYTNLYPSLPSGELTLKHWTELLKNIRKVLKRAIKQGGTTISDFVDTKGETGYFQNALAVYGKEGEKCRHCGNEIERYVLAGRSTYFCSVCQPRA